ncbi:MAG: efflux RND transporter periplasmic adaptor subunit [Oceanococcus sp.]
MCGIVWMLIGIQPAFSQAPAKTQAVIVADVTPRVMADSAELLATVMAQESVEIRAPVAELISRIAFEEGQSVEQGQLLLELAHDHEDASLRGALAAQVEAEANLKRLQDLHGRSLSSDSELDLARAKALVAAAAVDQAQASLQERMIHAPFSGVLGLRDASPGAYLSAGDLITTLHDVSALRLEFQLPETALPLWRPGAQLQVRIPALNEAGLTATAQADALAFSKESRSLRARARFSATDSRLRPGMLAVVTLQAPTPAVFAIPEAALVPHEGGYRVFVLEQGKAQAKTVDIGRRQRGWVEIRTGLQLGESVVIHGANKLRPGAEVQVLGRYDGSVSIQQIIRQTEQKP